MSEKSSTRVRRDGCTEATTELWSGGCRVLSDFFGGLSDSVNRSDKRRSREDDRDREHREQDRDRGVACLDVETVTTSTADAVAEAGRTLTRAAELCIEPCSRDEVTTTTVTTTTPAPAPKPAAGAPASKT